MDCDSFVLRIETQKIFNDLKTLNVKMISAIWMKVMNYLVIKQKVGW